MSTGQEIQAYFRLGAELKPSMLRLLEELVSSGTGNTLSDKPTSAFFGSYWGAEPGIIGQYNFLLPDEGTMLRAEPYRAEFCRRAESALRAADTQDALTDHRVGCGFYYSGMKNLPPLYRED